MTTTIFAVAAIVTTVCAYFVGKYSTLAKVWGCMAKSLDSPISREALNHHNAIRELLKKL